MAHKAVLTPEQEAMLRELRDAEARVSVFATMLAEAIDARDKSALACREAGIVIREIGDAVNRTVRGVYKMLDRAS